MSLVPSKNQHQTARKTNFPTVLVTHFDEMRGDLKKFWGIISGKQAERPQPRLRSTSLPRITPYGLIGFGTYEYVAEPKENKCSLSCDEYDMGKKCNTFPRSSTKQKKRPNIMGRNRSASVSVDVNPRNSPSPKYKRRASATPRYLKVDIDATINEEETSDVSSDVRNVPDAGTKTSKASKGKTNEPAYTTVLCSTDL